MKRSFFCLAALVVVVGGGIAGCILNDNNASPALAASEALSSSEVELGASCLVCHGNKAFLQANREQFLALEAANAVAQHDPHAAEEEVAGEEEEPVTAELLAAQLFVDVELMGVHGEQGCLACHKDVAEGQQALTPAWHTALATDPTADGGQVCASCHGQGMVDDFKSSLHFTMNGVAKGLCDRLAQTPNAQKTFDDIFYDPEPYMGCNTCHATCGQCHVSQPNIAGGGLLNSHQFTKKPSNEKTCNVCHYENSEYHLEVDVHATDADMSCTDCHTDAIEYHGRPLSEMSEGKLYYKGPDTTEVGLIEPNMKRDVVKVRCAQCHDDKVVDHPVKGVDHVAQMECVSCHTQPYANCFGCHDGEKPEFVGAWGSGDPDDLNVTLGLSIPGDVHSKLTTLNHAGMGDGVFGDGAPVVDTTNPETKSMWTSFAAHFVARNPLVSDAAKASGSMCDNCHNGNLEMFLKKGDLDLGGNDPLSEIKWAVPAERLPKH